MRQKRTLLFILSIFTISSLALSSCIGGSGQQAFAFEKAKLQKGDLIAYVVANGTVQPARSADIAWKTNGQVGHMLVSVMSMVKEGDQLGDISDSSLPTSILSARMDLINAQKALDDLQNWQTNAEQARLDVEQAKEDLDLAQRKLNGVNGRRRPIADFYIQSAQAELQLAEKDVDKAQNNYDHTPVDSDYKPVTLKLLATAKQNRDKALANLNYLTGTPSDMELERAEAEFALAQAKLDDAQRKYDRIKYGTPAEDITAAQIRVQISKATLEQAYITAPFPGLVTSVTSHEGDVVAPGESALRIEDQSHMYVQAQVSEIDVNRMKAGQVVEVDLDAVFGQTYHGKIIEIGNSGQSTQGVVNFPVKVEMTDQDVKVKTGMTAVLRIQAETVKDVLLVPNQAVRVKDGKRVVYIDKGVPMPQAVPVTLGVSSDLMSQILSGDVKAGDTVIMNPDIIPQQNQTGAKVGP